ncbi:hypothetical protein LSTR_LSTR005150 [Laodelphax striatellus]|uniref:Uncharacterized protein n=1 Tax=Laodelphax striatellus TaxID=195883 RepID=A0A482WQU1_LAOST|nr:hypothetical protein LSTR_LSTR005150 [Laodelphax striatellus]
MQWPTLIVALIQTAKVIHSDPIKTAKTPSDKHMHTSEWVQVFNHGNQGPENYVFSYDNSDSNNLQFQEERNENGTIVGSYGKMGPDGKMKIVHYVSDKKGYRTKEEDMKAPDMQKTKTILHKDILRNLDKNKKVQDGIMTRTSSADANAFLKAITLGQNPLQHIQMPDLMNLKSQDHPEFDLLYNVYPHDKRVDLKKLVSDYDTGNYLLLQYPFHL